MIDDPKLSNIITSDTLGLYNADFKVSKTGVSYIVFSTPFNGARITWLQIINKDEYKMFDKNGLMVNNKSANLFTMYNDQLFIDSDGNAIVVVSNAQNIRTIDSHNLHYTAYKISTSGKFLWGRNGINLDYEQICYMEAALKILQLEDDTYIFAWKKERAYDSRILSIVLRRFSKNGLPF